jgi:hypothetical protein
VARVTGAPVAEVGSASRGRVAVGDEPAAAVPTRPGPFAGALAFLFGAYLLVSAFDPGLPTTGQSVRFWLGLILSLSAAAAVALRRGGREWERVVALASLGALTYLPYLLRSPGHPIFSDDLYHQQSLRLIAESGHTDLPVTRFPIPGQFPGLELTTLWLHDTTGLGLETLAWVLPLAIHITIPLVVFSAANALGLNGRTAFMAAVLYIGNKAFVFFHSVYSYETLGILFFLTAWALVAACARDRAFTHRYAPLILVVLAAVTVTHHMSALMAGLGFVGLAIVTGILYRRAAVDAALLAVAGILLLNDWLVLHATKASEYLSAAFTARIGALIDTLKNEGQGTRKLFGQQALWQPEQYVAYVYPLLVFALCGAGVFLLLRRRRRRALEPMLLSLMIFGPVLWATTAPAVITGASELAYRAWPYLFLGVAIYGALALRALDRLARVSLVARRAAVIAALVLVVAGGVVVGDNPGGRFPREKPATAAGPEAVTTDVISAARWLSRSAGRHNRFAADNGSELVFSTYGDQEPVGYGNWLPFIAKTPTDVAHRLQELRASYLVVDRRISRLPARYGYYFGQEELFSPRTLYPQPFPRAQLAKLDRVSTLNRIYDNGNITIYGPVKPATAR